MKNSIKITFGICGTISFITLLILITISDIIIVGKASIDLGGFAIYSTYMLHIATAKVREGNNEKLNQK